MKQSSFCECNSLSLSQLTIMCVSSVMRQRCGRIDAGEWEVSDLSQTPHKPAAAVCVSLVTYYPTAVGRPRLMMYRFNPAGWEPGHLYPTGGLFVHIMSQFASRYMSDNKPTEDKASGAGKALSDTDGSWVKLRAPCCAFLKPTGH